MGSRTDSRYYLIMNPGSRSGESETLFAGIHEQMRHYRLNYEYAVTADLDDAEALARRAAGSGFDIVVAVGGDGTINRVINGLYKVDGTLLSAARLGVIYTGTSPDFCMSYRIPVRDIRRSVAVLAAARSKTIGIGRIRYADRTSRVFACCANIGLGAGLAQAANSGIRGKVGDKAGTFLSLVRVLAGYRPSGLTINGTYVPHVYNLSVGKTRYIASGLKVRHRIPMREFESYILCICSRPLEYIFRLYAGAALPLKYGRRIKVEGCAGVEFDGDPWGQLPVIIEPALPLEVIYERT